MKLNANKATILVCFTLIVIVQSVQTQENRDKRTIDFVLRSVADVFGYDVQKRPTVIPPPPPKAVPPPAAPPQPPQPKPTFFPPPLQPIRPNAIPTPTKNTRLNIPLPKKPMVPPPNNVLPTLPSGNVIPKPFTSVKPFLPKPAPAKPPVPPPKPPVPPPKPVVRTAPIPPRAAPTQTLRKTFNVSFNWNRSRLPVPPPSQAAAVPPKQPPPPPPPPPPSSAQPPQPKKWQQAPIYAMYDTPVQQNTNNDYEEQTQYQPVYQTQYPLIQGVQPTAQYLEEMQPVSNTYDTTNAVDSYGNKATSETITETTEKTETGDYDQSKDRFKESIKTFWENSPWRVQNGYKYIMPEEENQQIVYENPENQNIVYNNANNENENPQIIEENDKNVVYYENQNENENPEQNVDYTDLQGANKENYKRHREYLFEQLPYEEYNYSFDSQTKKPNNAANFDENTDESHEELKDYDDYHFNKPHNAKLTDEDSNKNLQRENNEEFVEYSDKPRNTQVTTNKETSESQQREVELRRNKVKNTHNNFENEYGFDSQKFNENNNSNKGDQEYNAYLEELEQDALKENIKPSTEGPEDLLRYEEYDIVENKKGDEVEQIVLNYDTTPPHEDELIKKEEIKNKDAYIKYSNNNNKYVYKERQNKNDNGYLYQQRNKDKDTKTDSSNINDSKNNVSLKNTKLGSISNDNGYVYHQHGITEDDFLKIPIFPSMDFASFGQKFSTNKNNNKKFEHFPKKVIKEPNGKKVLINYNLKTQPQGNKVTKQEIKLAKQETKLSQLVQPLYSGILDSKSGDLLINENNPQKNQVPFEMEYSGTHNVGKTVRHPKRSKRSFNYGDEDFKYEPDSYDSYFSYKIPDPTTENYEALEKITYDEDKEEEEEDKDLSKNARVTTRKSGKKYAIIKKDPTYHRTTF